MTRELEWLVAYPLGAIVLAGGLYVAAFVIAESGDGVALLIGFAVLVIGFPGRGRGVIGIG